MTDIDPGLTTNHLVIDVWFKGQRRSLDYADFPTSSEAVGRRVMELAVRLQQKADTDD